MLDQDRQDACDPLVLVGIELNARDAPPRQRYAVAARDQPKQDPARNLPVVLYEHTESRLCVAADDSAHAPRPPISLERQCSPLSLAPELEQRRREQRERAGFAGDVVDERIDKGRLDFQSGPLGRTLDRPAQLARAHRGEQDVIRHDEVGELDVRREVAEEVRAQGDQDERTAVGVPGGLDEGAHERRSLVLGDRSGKELLELVDHEQEPRARSHALERRGELGRRALARTDENVLQSECRQQTGTKERRFPAPGRSHDSKQLCVGETRQDLVDEPFATEEEVCVGRLERSEPLERTHPARRRRCISTTVDGDGQLRILQEDRPLELLELDARLQPELVIQEPPCLPIDLEPFGLAAAAVEREHELCAEALAVRVLGSERVQLGHERKLPAKRELCVDPLLDGGEPKLLESFRLDAS